MIPGISVFERSDGLKDIQRKKYGNIKTIYGTIQTKMYDYTKLKKVIRTNDMYWVQHKFYS